MLAVGVDNMFILANTLDTTDASRPLPERIGQALSEAGPSITLAATAGSPLQCQASSLLCDHKVLLYVLLYMKQVYLLLPRLWTGLFVSWT